MKRNIKRINLINFYSDSFTLNEVFIDIEVNGYIRGNVIDISTKGIGFEFHAINDKQIEIIKSSDDIFLKLFLRSQFLLIGVKLIWSIIKNENENEKLVFKGGFEINTISPEDNIKLSELIDKIRNSTL